MELMSRILKRICITTTIDMPSLPDNRPPSILSAVVPVDTYNTIIMEFNKDLDILHVPSTDDFVPGFSGGETTVTAVTIPEISGETKWVYLTLSRTIELGETGMIMYFSGTSKLQSEDGYDVLDFAQSVTNNSVQVKPEFVDAMVQNATPTVVTLTFTHSLDESLVPDPAGSGDGSFSVSVDSVLVNVTDLQVSNNSVILTIDHSVDYGEIIEVSYVKGTEVNITGTDNLEMDSFGYQAVTNNVLEVIDLVNVYMNLDTSAVVDGYYIDQSGNGLDAEVVTIDETNDGIVFPDDDTLREILREIGVYDMFYDSLDQAVQVKLSRIGRIYNNQMFRNDDNLVVCDELLTGTNLENNMDELFGAYDSDAETIITAMGITSELLKRLVDTHVKDLKAINDIQTNFFKYGDTANSVIKALYPFVGTSFDNFKYNWVDPQDQDNSFRLDVAFGDSISPRVLRGCVFFDSTFCLDTHFNANTHLGNTNSFSYYSIFDQPDAYINRYLSAIVYDENRYDMGCLGTSPTKGIDIKIRNENVSHSMTENTYQSPSKGVVYEETESNKLYLVNKLGDSDLKMYRDGVQIGSTMDPGASSYYDGVVILGGASQNGSILTSKLSVLPCGYFHIGGAIQANALKDFQDAVIRLVSSKTYFYFEPDETDPVI